MGYGSNYLVQEAEEACQEARNDEIYKQAATFVLDGYSRSEAIEKAKELDEEQQEALSKGEYSEDPETGVIDFFEDINGPAVPESKKHQIPAIVEELKNNFDL